MLRNITKEQFREIYAGTDILKDEEILFKSDLTSQEVQEALYSKLWRMNHLYSITTKRGRLTKFNMNLAQHKVYADSLRHSRLIILKSRQQGISTLWLISFFDDACFYKHFKVGLMANNDENAEKLLDRTKLLWSELDDSIKQLLNLEIVKDNTKEISFNNDSSIYIRTSFRSGTLQRLHISELGDIAENSAKKAEEVMTGSVQAISPGNTVIIESTAKGRNKFYDLWHDAVNLHETQRTEDDFKPVFLSWLDDPDCNEPVEQILDVETKKYFEDLEEETKVDITQSQKNFWVAKKRKIKEKILKEFPATAEEAFRASRDGTYYAQLYQDHVVKNKRNTPFLPDGYDLYDKNIQVQAGFDIGMHDYTVIFFFQYYQGFWRFLDEYVNNGKDIEHYCNVIKDYRYPVHHIILPHDAEVRELGTGRSRLEIFNDHLQNDYDITKLDKESIADGIETVREAIKTMYVHPNCVYLKSVLTKHSKQWDDKLEVWLDKEKRTELRHGSDCLRYCIEGTEDAGEQNDVYESRAEYYGQRRMRGSFDI